MRFERGYKQILLAYLYIVAPIYHVIGTWNNCRNIQKGCRLGESQRHNAYIYRQWLRYVGVANPLRPTETAPYLHCKEYFAFRGDTICKSIRSSQDYLHNSAPLWIALQVNIVKLWAGSDLRAGTADGELVTVCHVVVSGDSCSHVMGLYIGKYLQC